VLLIFVCCIIQGYKIINWNDLKFLNILISSFLVGASPQAIPDSDGWVPVERPDVHQDYPEVEEGVWVVFSKELEGEKFHVRFPDDPSYRYYSGGIQFDIAQGEDRLQLQVEKRGQEEIEPLFQRRIEEIGSLPKSMLLKAKRSVDGGQIDLFYRLDEKWVWERMISTSKLLYTFRTESPEMAGNSHRQFIASLDVFH
jgi:hypothetical protein